MTLTAGLIVKNEAANLRACLESIRDHVDRIVVVDTGSTDDTEAIARQLCDKFETFTECNGPDGIEDFAMARNHVLSLVEPDSWFFWCDGDDTVQKAPNLRGLISQHPKGQTGMYLFPYEYSFDAQGNVTTLHWRERLVHPVGKFKWHMPVHEVLMPSPELGQVVGVRSDAVGVRHNRTGKALEGNRNLRILEKFCAEKEGKEDLRAQFYLGLELKRAARVDEARKVLTGYVDKTGWADEKCIALLELGSLELSAENVDAAITWGLQAQVTKSWPDPFYLIGYALHNLALGTADPEQKLYHYQRAANYLRQGSELGLRGAGANTVLFSNPAELYESQRVLCACLATVGDFVGAVESCRLGLKGFPDDKGLFDYLKEFENLRDKQQLTNLIGAMHARGGISQEQVTIIGHALEDKFSVKVNRPKLEAPKPEDGKLEIVFYTGQAWEDWTPLKVEEEGMGGSETMCVDLAKRLAAMGHAVRVYGQPDEEGMFDGVQYLHHDRWGDVKGDVLVASRTTEAVDSCSFRLKLLWIHDVHCGDALTRARILRFDRVLALSEWHKGFLCDTYPMLDPERVFVTRNGIDLKAFSPEVLQTEEKVFVERNCTRAIYSSSPDRGLRLALKLWPRIRELVPGAEFHIFYGFEGWEKSCDMFPGHPELCRAALEETKGLLDQLGVFSWGRVPPKQLAKEFLRSGVWYYPTWFSETSCITAMQAQAAGCFPVTTGISALTETVRNGTMFEVNEGTTFEYGGVAHCDWVVKQMHSALSSTSWFSRTMIQQAADAFSIDTLAEDWHELFGEWLVEVEDGPVPVYRKWRAA